VQLLSQRLAMLTGWAEHFRNQVGAANTISAGTLPVVAGAASNDLSSARGRQARRSTHAMAEPRSHWPPAKLSDSQRGAELV